MKFTLQPEPQAPVFTRRDTIKLCIPLVIEQFLAISIGLADTMMVAGVSEEAMSAVSVVDSISILLINIFAALATGGAIITARHLGCHEDKDAGRAAAQLFTAVFILSLGVAGTAGIFNAQILTGIYGALEPDVLADSKTYFFISSISYPFIALYNAGAAILRAEGNSKATMYISVAANVMNVCGNALLIYGFGLGVAGAAISTLISRAIGAVCVILSLTRHGGKIHFDSIKQFAPDFKMIKRILRLGIPTGLENGMFQIGKILVQRLVTLGGTISIAANAATSSIANLILIPSAAMGMALVTLSGQALGAGREDEARYHTKSLLVVSHIAELVISSLCLIFMDGLFVIYNLEPDTTALAKTLVTTYCIASVIMWPESFVLPNTLRAAGDVRFTMTVSLISMWVARIGFSYFFFYVMELGTLSVWLAMYSDWVVRTAFMVPRFCGKKWLRHKV